MAGITAGRAGARSADAVAVAHGLAALVGAGARRGCGGSAGRLLDGRRCSRSRGDR
jgi:hypothetical protein